MKVKIQKILSLLFIIIGLTPFLFAFLLIIKKYDIHHRLKEEFEIKVLQIVSIPESEVIWMGKHEININNRMFDISTVRLEKGIYTFTGLYDDEETELRKQQRNPVSQSTENMYILSQAFKFLQNVYFDQPALSFDLTQQQNKYPSFLSSAVVLQYLKIPTPPPQFIC